MYLRNPYYMQTEENWIQKQLYYSYTKIVLHFEHSQSCNNNKNQNEFYSWWEFNEQDLTHYTTQITVA